MKFALKLALLLSGGLLLSACTFNPAKFMNKDSSAPLDPNAEYEESLTDIRPEDIEPGEPESATETPPELLPVE